PTDDSKPTEKVDELINRADDTDEPVRKRLGIYHDQTMPLFDYYLAEAKSGNTEYLKLFG
ncbi:adenylate kinase, partial [Pseudoalteromonas sp. S1609]